MESSTPSSRFFDGVSSTPSIARLSMTDQSLIITCDNQSPVIWSYTKIFVKEDWHPETGAILGFRDNQDAGLAIHDHQQFLIIQKKLSGRDRASFILPTQYRYLFLMLMGAIVSGMLLFPLLGYLSSFVTYFIPYSVEKKLGDAVITQMNLSLKTCNDKEALAGLKKITDRLSQSLDHKNFDIEIHLYQSYSANAFSLPGGKIAILSGFLTEANSENEIAAVLAHEMGHMVERDSLDAFVESQGMELIAGMIGASGSFGGVAEMAGYMQSLNYSRKKEFAADEFGTQLLIKSGYSPTGLSSFLSRMDREDPVMNKAMQYLEFLSTHPDTKERVRRIEKVEASDKFRASLTRGEFQNMKQACQ